MNTDSLVAVYRRFAHLDRMIVEAGESDDPYRRTCAALWEAVKKYCEVAGHV